MSSSREILLAQLKKYLDSCTAHELQDVMNTIQSAQQAHKRQILPNADDNKPANSLNSSTAKVTKSRRRSSCSQTIDISNSTIMRPLNSWMAFRSYYSPIFASYQQKAISPLLTKLWAKDPFHNKWTILAKAYSKIRDVKGKIFAPLNDFLAHACPLLEIINPKDYLFSLGWRLVAEGDTVELLKTISSTISTNHHMCEEKLSVDFVLTSCHYNGYINNDDLLAIIHRMSPMQESSLLMAVGSSMSTFVNETEHTNTVIGQLNNNKQLSSKPLTNFPQDGEELKTWLEDSHNDTQSSTPQRDRTLLPTIGEGGIALSRNVERLANSGDVYPFYQSFSPNNFDQAVFDPYAISQFNSYIIGRFDGIESDK